MTTCPKCGAEEHVETAAAAKTAARYPALRELAKIYRVLAGLTLMVGFVRVLNDVRTLFDTDAPASAKAAMTPFVVATEALVTGFAVVTCIAIAEAIKLLFELNDRPR